MELKSNQEIEKQKRIKNYEKKREEMLALGYKEQVGTLSVLKGNLLAFVTAGPFAVLALIIYLSIWKEINIIFGVLDSWNLFVLLLISIPIHELIHGITWSIYCKAGWKSIEFGVIWKILTPYCHCKETLKFKSYLLGGLMPFMVLGIGLFLVSVVLQNPILLILSILNILSAGGDTTIACMLLKYRDAEILGHPTECGFIAFQKQ